MTARLPTYAGELDALARNLLARHGYRAALVLVNLSAVSRLDDPDSLEIIGDLRAALARLARREAK